jgi:hypothetical protein
MSALRMFIPITKVDASRRLVYGLATAEAEDRAGEICVYVSTKPLYEKWSQDIAQSTGGKSLGNLRAMHGPVAAGKVAAINFNDEAKQIEICAKVVDDAEWAKVEEGVYTGFSQGGSYVRRWTDADGLGRYTAEPNEISLVDLPCLPQARFEMVKRDGTREMRAFRQTFVKGLDNVARLAGIVQELDCLQNSAALEETAEQDASKVPGQLKDLVTRASAILRAMVAEETLELTEVGEDSQLAMTMFVGPKKDANAKRAVVAKIGARNNAEDATRIQAMHDTSVELGASCNAQKVLHGGFEKRFDAFAETLADILLRVKKIEEQPLPLPLAGSAHAISKHEDGVAESPAGEAIEKLLSNPDALSVLAIKLAQRRGHTAGMR